MKVVTLVSRIVLGLAYTVFSLAFFFQLLPKQNPGGAAGQFMAGLFAASYVMPTVKAIELITGILFLIGRFVPLAAVLAFPITLNILLFHLFLAPGEALIAVVMFVANGLLFYSYKDSYNGLLVSKKVVQ